MNDLREEITYLSVSLKATFSERAGKKAAFVLFEEQTTK